MNEASMDEKLDPCIEAGSTTNGLCSEIPGMKSVRFVVSFHI
jgi:hypothetical protein